MKSNRRPIIWIILCCAITLSLVFVQACPPPTISPPTETSQDASNPPETGSDTAATVESTAEKESKEPKEPKVDLFDATKILKVDIVMAEADWDAVRQEERNYDNLLNPNCRDKPFESPFNYRKASVTVDGVTLDNVGVRKKGFVGSIDSNKPSLKLKFDEFVEKQELHGLERMTLNNNRSDRSFIRQCLTYRWFAKAGIPAPRCNFAHVSINGKSLGLFSHIESVKKAFLRKHFTDDSGHLYEGTLSDFREGWLGTFEAKTTTTNTSRQDLNDVANALNSPDDKLVAALTPHIDLPRFMQFWAAETLVNHLDGYAGNTNNFYIYNDPKTSQFVFLPWGVDATFTPFEWQPQGAPKHVLAKSHLAWRLYRLESTRQQYVAALQKLLDTVWKESELLTQIDEMEKFIATQAIADRAHNGNAETFKAEVTKVRDFVNQRRAILKPIIDKPPAWDAPLPKGICFTPNGSAKGTFTTKFGTLEVQDPFASGTGTYTGMQDNQPVTAIKIGSKAGYDPKVPNQAVIQLIIQVTNTQFMVAGFVLNDGDAKINEPFDLRSPLKGGKSYLISFDSQTRQSKVLSILWRGTMTLTEANNTKDAPIVGSFDVQWVTPPQP